MKKELNLVHSNMKNLSKKDLKNVLGGIKASVEVGNVCGCGCCGPSSSADNGIANSDAGKNSTKYCF